MTSPVISQTLAGQATAPAPHKIQGIGAGFVPKNLDLSLLDQVELVSDEEAKLMALRLMREEGILWDFLWRSHGRSSALSSATPDAG